MKSLAHLTRFEIDSSRYDKGMLLLSGRGLAGEVFEDLPYIQPHGSASRPPKGAIGTVMVMAGRRTQAVVAGVEHTEMRPDLPVGGQAIYDAAGNIVSIVQADIRIVHSSKVHIIAPEIILEGTVKLGGPDADKPASMQGTVDTGGFSDVSSLATKVLVK